jgi:hypothetical protein
MTKKTVEGKYCSECGQVLPLTKATHIVTIMDMSGSMQPQHDEVLSAYNAFIKEQQALKEEAYVSLFMFDDVIEHPYLHLDLNKVGTLTKDTYQPRGMTALFDAIDSALTEYPGTKTEKTLFVIITDGFENASRKVRSAPAIKTSIERARKNGCEFVFLAADEASFAQGAWMGISAGNTFNYKDVGYGGGTQVMSASLTNYRASNTETTDCFFVDTVTTAKTEEEEK